MKMKVARTVHVLVRGPVFFDHKQEKNNERQFWYKGREDRCPGMVQLRLIGNSASFMLFAKLDIYINSSQPN